MRIVAGRHRGRRLRAPPGRAVRPTGERAREALFDILAHGLDWPGLEGAHVADVFCGTGAVALEALSRGAAFATLVDNGAEACAAARRNIASLGEEARARLLRNDATKPMPRPGRAVAFAHVDPPWRAEVAAEALAAMRRAGWFEPGALACVELHRRAAFAPPEGFETADDRAYGDARLLFLRLRRGADRGGPGPSKGA